MQTQDLAKPEKDNNREAIVGEYPVQGDRESDSQVEGLASLDTAEADLTHLVEVAQSNAQSVLDATVNAGGETQEATTDHPRVEKALSDSELVAVHAVRASRAVVTLRTTLNVGELN